MLSVFDTTFNHRWVAGFVPITTSDIDDAQKALMMVGAPPMWAHHYCGVVTLTRSTIPAILMDHQLDLDSAMLAAHALADISLAAIMQVSDVSLTKIATLAELSNEAHALAELSTVTMGLLVRSLVQAKSYLRELLEDEGVSLDTALVMTHEMLREPPLNGEQLEQLQNDMFRSNAVAERVFRGLYSA